MIVSANRTLPRLGPSTATRAIASNRPGNASRTSMILLTRSSTTPPKYAATAPSVVPTSADTETTVRPTRNEIRAPASTRARMSRPSSSSPKRCDPLGPSNLSASSWPAGSYGVSSGPATAATAVIAMMDAPIQSSVRCGRLARAPSFIPNPRIEETVCEIDEQVHRHIGDRDQQNAALNGRIVARADRLNEQAAHARPRKNRLGDDRAREHGAKLKTEHRDDRNQAVAKGMFQDGSRPRHTLGPRGQHVKLSQFFNQAGPRHPRQDSRERRAERNRRQHEMREGSAARNRQPAERDRKHDREQRSQPERG